MSIKSLVAIIGIVGIAWLSYQIFLNGSLMELVIVWLILILMFKYYQNRKNG